MTALKNHQINPLITRPALTAGESSYGGFRHAVLTMSDSPLILPLTPLGTFVMELDPLVDSSAIRMYIMRLRAHSWDMIQLTERLRECGIKLSQEVCFSLSRGLPTLLYDTE